MRFSASATSVACGIAIAAQCAPTLAHITTKKAGVPAVRQYDSPSAYADAVATAPGTYVAYTWPSSAEAGGAPSQDVGVEHTWVSIPDGSDTRGNGVFASSQYFFHAPNGTQLTGGYLGSQVIRADPGTGGEERRVFIFSCWDTDPKVTGTALQVGWTTPNTCARFGGEGVGSHCILDYPVKPGTSYAFTVRNSGHNQSGAFWTGEVVDKSTGNTSTVGTLYFPNALTGMQGFGGMSPWSNMFLEYFLGGTCDDDVYVGVGLTGPFFHNHATPPISAKPSYPTSGDCNRTEVTACIPGVGCGKPNVFVQGGRGVVRNNTDATVLW